MRKKVFICSPFRGDMEGNARKAAAYSRMACEEGCLPIAPHLLFPQFLNEGIEEERRLGIAMGMGQFTMPEGGEFSEKEMDKYVSGMRVYEDRFEWLLNLSPGARGELDDAGSPVYFTKLTVTPDGERAWFRMHPQWSKSNKYAELEAWIYI